MSKATVDLTILGFSYPVSCNAEEVERVQALGQTISTRMSELAGQNSGHSPTRLFLLLCLELLDQVESAGHSHPQVNHQASDALEGAQTNDAVLEATQLYLAQVFEQMATRIDGLQKELLSVEGKLPKSA